MVRESGIDGQIGNSQQPEIGHSVNLDGDCEGGRRQSDFSYFVELLPEIVIT